MKIQVNSDKQVKVTAEVSDAIKAQIEQALARFAGHVTRVEAHLSDLNSSSKPGLRDKRCLLEARPAGKKPVSADFTSATVEQAVRGAAGKMRRLLETDFAKGAHQTSRRSLREGKRTVRSARTLDKLQRIQESLSQVLEQAEEHPAPVRKQMERAAAALRQAHRMSEQAEPKAPARRATRTTPKKGAPAAGGRSPKKKGIYRARRKGWPAR